MVKLLAELHGGAVAVESATGDGSSFTVWLPVREPQGGLPAPAKSLATAPRVDVRGEARVALVVEDDAQSAELIRVQLEAEGFTVLHADSAEAALAIASEQPLSLISLDIMLPNMDGWEFLGHLKKTPALAGIPVVIVSIVADRSKGLALGAAAVMQKPISRQDLCESLVDLGLFPLSASEDQKLKVLVVDDDPKAVELIAARVAGLAVHRAYGGREAIDAARRELPDLIVLDLMMPGVDGFEVVRALQEHPDTACIPILVVTAKQVTLEDRERLNGSVATVIEKTALDTERFAAEVRSATGHRKLVA
jgi:CheY-like chemotaxis protein